MTLLDAQEFDEKRARRRRITIGTIVVVVLVLGWLAWMYRYLPQERIAAKFFGALQAKQFETAYGLWFNDPDWKNHQEKYAAKYPYNEFYRDWGPGGEWGPIHSFKIYASGTPPGGGSGVIVEVIVNDRAEHARLWIEKADKTLSFSPY